MFQTVFLFPERGRVGGLSGTNEHPWQSWPDELSHYEENSITVARWSWYCTSAPVFLRHAILFWGKGCLYRIEFLLSDPLFSNGWDWENCRLRLQEGNETGIKEEEWEGREWEGREKEGREGNGWEGKLYQEHKSMTATNLEAEGKIKWHEKWRYNSMPSPRGFWNSVSDYEFTTGPNALGF